jgi:hypothetical protein
MQGQRDQNGIEYCARASDRPAPDVVAFEHAAAAGDRDRFDIVAGESVPGTTVVPDASCRGTELRPAASRKRDHAGLGMTALWLARLHREVGLRRN